MATYQLNARKLAIADTHTHYGTWRGKSCASFGKKNWSGHVRSRTYDVIRAEVHEAKLDKFPIVLICALEWTSVMIYVVRAHENILRCITTHFFIRHVRSNTVKRGNSERRRNSERFSLILIYVVGANESILRHVLQHTPS